MKKAKRFLTGLLSAALALSLCAMPAMAADNRWNNNDNHSKLAVLDGNAKVTITIHKYEYNGNEDRAGNRRRQETQNNVPSKNVDGKTETPTPLAGATFTVLSG